MATRTIVVGTADAVSESTANAKGDLLAATANDTITRLAVGTNDQVLTADSAEATGIKWAAATGGGEGITNGILTDSWYQNPLQGVVGTANLAFPTVNRLYYDPWFLSEEQTITAVGLDMSAAGTASNVLRIGIFDDNGSHAPGTLLAQSTVAGDGIAMLTWTLGTPQAVGPGIFWIAVGPQGSGSGGTVRGAIIANPFSVDIGESGASFASTYISASTVPARFENNSGTLSSSPTIVLETNNRHASTFLRFQ